MDTPFRAVLYVGGIENLQNNSVAALKKRRHAILDVLVLTAESYSVM